MSTPSPRRPVWKPVGWPWLALPFLLFLLLPLAALLGRASPAVIWDNLGQTAVRQAIHISLSTSLLATALTVIFGVPVAYLLARRQLRWKSTLEALIDLPTVLPPAVAGLALLLAFGRRGWLGGYLEAANLHIAFTPAAVVLAQMFVAAPLFLKAATIGFASVEPELEQAAEMDGAGRWGVFWHVTLPLSRRALLGGGVLAWTRALGEFGATIIFAGNYPGRTQTMPLAIYLGFELDLDLALTLAVILVGCSFVALWLLKGFLERE